MLFTQYASSFHYTLHIFTYLQWNNLLRQTALLIWNVLEPYLGRLCRQLNRQRHRFERRQRLPRHRCRVVSCNRFRHLVSRFENFSATRYGVNFGNLCQKIERLITFWAHFEPTLAKILPFGQTFIMTKNKLTPSGHLVTLKASV